MNAYELDKFIRDKFRELENQIGGTNPLDFYIFQTDYIPNPELMIVGINPGGQGKNNVFTLGSSLRNNAEQHSNYLDNHLWFAHLREIFGYPGDTPLATSFKYCVGLNLCGYNTSTEKKIGNLVEKDARELIRKTIVEIIEAISPKRIITLGGDPFHVLRNGQPITNELVEKVNLRFSNHNGIPLCWIYNPSPQPWNKYYSKSDLSKIQARLSEFLHTK